jgi:hypothetical protein
MDSIFAQLNLDPQVFLWAGGILAAIAVIMIIKKGLVLVLWSLVLIVGVSGFNYGMQGGGVSFSDDLRERIDSIVEPGKALSKDAMKQVCERLAVEERGTRAWCEAQREKPKSGWSTDDAVLYAKACVL